MSVKYNLAIAIQLLFVFVNYTSKIEAKLVAIAV